jgi:hypothetical protein
MTGRHLQANQTRRKLPWAPPGLDYSEILDGTLGADNHLPLEIEPGSDQAGKGELK